MSTMRWSDQKSPLLRSLGRRSVETLVKQPKRTLLSRVMPSLGPELRSPSGNPEVGVKQTDNARIVVMKARLEEICLRTVSEFGL
jgi:hypothetical protein